MFSNVVPTWRHQQHPQHEMFLKTLHLMRPAAATAAAVRRRLWLPRQCGALDVARGLSTSSALLDTAVDKDPVVAKLLEVVSTLHTPLRPLVLCGPSGVGKSYVLKKLCQAAPDRVALSVSHTSRARDPLFC
jgi:hypothetical protein